MYKVKLSSQYQIVIPSKLRKKLNIHSGDNLIIDEVKNKKIYLKKEPSYHDLIGIHANRGDDPVKRIRNIRENWR